MRYSNLTSWSVSIILMFGCATASGQMTYLGGGQESFASAMAEAAVKKVDAAAKGWDGGESGRSEVISALTLLEVIHAAAIISEVERAGIEMERARVYDVLDGIRAKACRAETEERTICRLASHQYDQIAEQGGWNLIDHAMLLEGGGEWVEVTPSAEACRSVPGRQDGEGGQVCNLIAWLSIEAKQHRADERYELSTRDDSTWSLLVVPSDLSKSPVHSDLKAGFPADFEIQDARVRLSRRVAVTESQPIFPSFSVRLESLTVLTGSTAGVAQAWEVESDTQIAARFDSGETLWLKLPVKESRIYTVETSGLSAGCDTAAARFQDPLTPGREVPIQEDDDGGDEALASRLRWFARSEGRELIRFRSLDSGRCRFKISLTSEGLPLGIEPLVSFASREEAIAHAVEPSEDERVIMPSPDGYIALRIRRDHCYSLLVTGEVELALASNLPLDTEAHECRTTASPETGVVVRAWSDSPVVLHFDSKASFEPLRATFREIEQVEAIEATTQEMPLHLTPGDVLVSELTDDRQLVVKLELAEESFAVVSIVPLDVPTAVRVDFAEEGGEDVVTQGAYDPLSWFEDFDEFGSVDDSGVTQFAFTSAHSGTYLLKVEGSVGADASGRVAARLEVEAPFNGLAEEDCVLVGRHRTVMGERNWAGEEMDQYVGRYTRIDELVGQESDLDDNKGPYLVRLAVDSGRWVWRTRELERVPDEHCSDP